MMATLAVGLLLLFGSYSSAQDTAGSRNIGDACYINPAADACNSFFRAESDLALDAALVCAKNGSLTGCTLWQHCKNGTAGGPLCNTFSIVADLCTEAPGAAGCEAYEALCAAGSKAPQCSCFPAVPNMLSSTTAKEAMLGLCYTHYMTQCDQCGKAGDAKDPGPCKDPLTAVSSACQEMPNMPECSGFWEMCNVEKVYTAFPKLCSKTGSVPAGWTAPSTPANCVSAAAAASAPSPAPSPATGGATVSPGTSSTLSNGTTQFGTPSRNMTDACYTGPSSEGCAGFQRLAADWTDDLAKLCHDMPFMTGCTLWTACQNANTTRAEGPFCQPQSLVADICSDTDMARMKGCEAYAALCSASGSVVAQCKQPGPVPGILRTFNTRTQIQGMCSTHGMVGCEDCVGTSWTSCKDPLKTIAQLCLGMPEMSDCADYQAMCSNAEVSANFPSVCTLEGQAAAEGRQTIPPMKMYLHQSWTEIILTLNWIPRNPGEMVGAWFACFFSAIFVQALKTWRLLVEARWAKKRVVSCCAGAGTSDSDDSSDGKVSKASWLHEWQIRTFNRPLITKEQFFRNAVRCLFTFVIVFIDYMLMLIVMTFNVAIILWTCAGFGVGALLFGHAGERPITPGAEVKPSDAYEHNEDIETTFVENGGCCGGKHV